MHSTSTIERAFQLARDSDCRSMGDLRTVLKLERYDCVDAHLSGKSIGRQLQAAMKAQRKGQETGAVSAKDRARS